MRGPQLEPFAREHGDKRIATVRRIDIQCLIDAEASTPGMARRLLSSLSVLMDYAIALAFAMTTLVSASNGLPRCHIVGKGNVTAGVSGLIRAPGPVGFLSCRCHAGGWT
jgi:hypothetical protein